MAKATFVILLCVLVQIFEVKCGSRIIGGNDAPPGSAPYMVSLRTDSFFHFCGGGLINSEWVLTAAHCISGGGEINVAAGSNTLDPRNVVIRSRSLHVHPEHDIGLVKLSQPIQFSNLIQPLSLPTFDISANSKLTITGWGATQYIDGDAGNAPNNLKILEVTSMETRDCTAIFDDIYQERDLCTVGVNGRGICFGDSGSPLVANNVIHGVASRVVPCAVGGPDMYTRVYYQNDWIRDTMSRN